MIQNKNWSTAWVYWGVDIFDFSAYLIIDWRFLWIKFWTASKKKEIPWYVITWFIALKFYKFILHCSWTTLKFGFRPFDAVSPKCRYSKIRHFLMWVCDISNVYFLYVRFAQRSPNKRQRATFFQLRKHGFGLQRYSQSRRPHSSRPFHDLTGSIWLFHHSIPETVNGGMVPVVIPAGGFFLGMAGN